MILVCKHGHTVTVHVQTYSPICWDDGILSFDKNGTEIHTLPYDRRPDQEYLEVTGCKHCTLIRLQG